MVQWIPGELTAVARPPAAFLIRRIIQSAPSALLIGWRKILIRGLARRIKTKEPSASPASGTQQALRRRVDFGIMGELEEGPREQENIYFVSVISAVVSHVFGHGGHARRR
jgi:hypothetical protein